MNINFKWIGGATWILTIDDLKIACDPVLCPKGTVQDYKFFKTIRLNEPVFENKDFNNVDIWLLTHGHEDHIDKDGIKVINKNSKIICNNNAYKIIKNNFTAAILKWNDVLEFSIKKFNIKIKAMPAVHSVNPLAAILAGNVNGYFLEISNKKEKLSVYVTSDTIINKKILNYVKNLKPDIIIPNMGGAKKSHILGPLTMTADMLKKLLKNLEYKIVIPVHFGTFKHYEEPIKAVKKLDNNKIKVLDTGDKIKIKL